jgi:hypothetical protein
MFKALGNGAFLILKNNTIFLFKRKYLDYTTTQQITYTMSDALKHECG